MPFNWKKSQLILIGRIFRLRKIDSVVRGYGYRADYISGSHRNGKEYENG